MWVVLQAWFARFALAALGWIAAVGAVLALLFGARQAGRNVERVEGMQKKTEVQHEQLRAAARRARNRDELTKRMRDGRF